MTVVGIITPYGLSEVTSAAVRLAELCFSRGYDVRLAATSTPVLDVHPFWDARVRRSVGDSLHTTLTNCTHVIHFEPCVAAFGSTALVAEGAKHILVPTQQALSRPKRDGLSVYDFIVCPSRACHSALSRFLLRRKDAPGKQLLWCHWDAGLGQADREGMVKDRCIRACFFCDSSAVGAGADDLLDVMDKLLHDIKDLELTVLSTRAWPRRERRHASALCTRWGERLAWEPAGNLIHRAATFHRHDWVVLPGLRYDFGITAALAAACGTPCIAYDVPPINELAPGVMVACVAPGRSGALLPAAQPDPQELLRACRYAFQDHQGLWELQQRCAQNDHVSRAQVDFATTWDGVLA